jgi:hypothetical protein
VLRSLFPIAINKVVRSALPAMTNAPPLGPNDPEPSDDTLRRTRPESLSSLLQSLPRSEARGQRNASREGYGSQSATLKRKPAGRNQHDVWGCDGPLQWTQDWPITGAERRSTLEQNHHWGLRQPGQ